MDEHKRLPLSKMLAFALLLTVPVAMTGCSSPTQSSINCDENNDNCEEGYYDSGGNSIYYGSSRSYKSSGNSSYNSNATNNSGSSYKSSSSSSSSYKGFGSSGSSSTGG